MEESIVAGVNGDVDASAKRRMQITEWARQKLRLDVPRLYCHGG
jgi:hypothetical protein